MAKEIFGYIDHTTGTRKYRCHVPQTNDYGWSQWRNDADAVCPEDDPEGHYDHINRCREMVKCFKDAAVLIEPYKPSNYSLKGK